MSSRQKIKARHGIARAPLPKEKWSGPGKFGGKQKPPMPPGRALNTTAGPSAVSLDTAKPPATAPAVVLPTRSLEEGGPPRGPMFPAGRERVTARYPLDPVARRHQSESWDAARPSPHSDQAPIESSLTIGAAIPSDDD